MHPVAVYILGTAKTKTPNPDPTSPLGEFEQLVLLATLQLEQTARARDIRARIEASAKRSVSRGALYATLDRLVAKSLLDWELEPDAVDVRGRPAPSALPDFAVLLNPERGDAARYRTDLSTFDPPG